MTTEEARALVVGDRVEWLESFATVTEVGRWIEIEWDRRDPETDGPRASRHRAWQMLDFYKASICLHCQADFVPEPSGCAHHCLDCCQCCTFEPEYDANEEADQALHIARDEAARDA